MFKEFVMALGLVGGTAATAQTYVFPIDRNAVAPDGSALLVSDEMIVSAIPRLHDVPRLRTCIDSMPGSAGTLQFTPSVTGPHAGLSNRLDCASTPTPKFSAAKPGLLVCSEAPEDQRAIVFDSDPAQYVVLGDGVPL